MALPYDVVGWSAVCDRGFPDQTDLLLLSMKKKIRSVAFFLNIIVLFGMSYKK